MVCALQHQPRLRDYLAINRFRCSSKKAVKLVSPFGERGISLLRKLKGKKFSWNLWCMMLQPIRDVVLYDNVGAFNELENDSTFYVHVINFVALSKKHESFFVQNAYTVFFISAIALFHRVDHWPSKNAEQTQMSQKLCIFYLGDITTMSRSTKNQLSSGVLKTRELNSDVGLVPIRLYTVNLITR